MRELTFRGFLTNYVKELSAQNTTSIFKLAAEASSNNYRLREPLFLYALISNKAELLLRATKDEILLKHYHNLLQTYTIETIIQAMLEQDSNLPERYRRIWTSYQCDKNMIKTNNHTKQLMRAKILMLQKKCGLSNYRIYTDLGLNPGSFNTWLKHGDGNKIRLETARIALRYVENVDKTRVF